jgi:RNA polymerase sigma-70 factor (ECF subfamily)
LVGTAGLILGDAAQAEDAAQEAMVRAWRDLPSLRDPERFEGWLYRLLIHACHDQRRQARHELRIDELIPGQGRWQPDASAQLADRDEIDRGLERLTADQRAVVVLRYYLGLSDAEIAQATRIPLGTVKSRLNRALSALRAALAAEARVGPAEERVT